MTKNNSNGHQTVTVISQDGENIGLTYPRRAAGLVKKGRARYVNDNTIRLNSVSDVTTSTEDIKMDNINTLNETKTPEQPINRLYFNAREWSFNKDCQKNVGSRSFMQGPDGIISEAFTIGDWGYNWTEIVTKSLILPKKMLHTFTFWLNGGENDNNNEVCRLEIIFNNDYENRYTYNLNRNFIKPLKKVNGWELYEIPFITDDNEYTQLRFVAQRAYMTVMNAKPKEEYADLPDNADEFEGERPQRHNIVFDDGFPTNTWYSTKALREKKIRRQLSGQDWENKTLPTPPPVPLPPPVPAPPPFSNAGNSVLPELEALQGSIGSMLTEMINKLTEESIQQEFIHRVQQAVEEAINEADSGDSDVDADQITGSILEQFGDKFSDITDEITDKLEDVFGRLENAIDDISDRLDDSND